MTTPQIPGVPFPFQDCPRVSIQSNRTCKRVTGTCGGLEMDAKWQKVHPERRNNLDSKKRPSPVVLQVLWMQAVLAAGSSPGCLKEGCHAGADAEADGKALHR